MDMAPIDELARAIPRLLRAGGRFVFSVLHPCFGGSGATRFAEERYEKSGVVTAIGVKVSRYLSAWHELGNFMTGQPEPHICYNRPISALLAPFFAAGLSLDGLAEPAFAPPAPQRSSLVAPTLARDPADLGRPPAADPAMRWSCVLRFATLYQVSARRRPD